MRILYHGHTKEHKKIKEKIKNKLKLNKQDIIDLILIPFMETKRKASNILEENINLLNKITRRH